MNTLPAPVLNLDMGHKSTPPISAANQEPEWVPLPGREKEFASTLSFLEKRWHREDEVGQRSLFVYGACGCGKTTTILRALRFCVDRPIPGDTTMLSTATSVASPLLSSRTSEEKCNTSVTAGVMSCRKRGRRRSDVDEEAEINNTWEDDIASTFSSARSSMGGGISTTRSSTSAASTMEREPLSPSRSSAAAAALRGLEEKGDNDNDGGGLDVEMLNPQTKEYWNAQFPHLSRRKVGIKRVYAHYINCADLNGPQLFTAIGSSMKTTCPRPDPATRAIMNDLDLISKGKITHKGGITRYAGRRFNARGDGDEGEDRVEIGECIHSACMPGPLHVMVLDEVEYVRGHNAHRAISTLATCMAHHHDQNVVLIFISNQRHLVHVPSMLLHDLGFEAYTVEQLQSIAKSIAERGLQEALPDPAQRARVQVTPSLLQYIARKALTDFSGDARQVIAMCRRVVFAGVTQLQATPPAFPTEGSTTTRRRRPSARLTMPRPGAATRRTSTTTTTTTGAAVVSSSQLLGLVDTFASEQQDEDATRKRRREEAAAASHHASSSEAETSSSAHCCALQSLPTEGDPSSSSSTRSSTSSTGAGLCTNSGASGAGESSRNRTSGQQAAPVVRPEADSPLTASLPTTTLSLASNVKLLRSCVVEEEAERYIASMTEQMAYVLGCLVVLRLQHDDDLRRQRTAISGVIPSSSSAGSGVTARRVAGGGTAARVTSGARTNGISLRELHTLYATLMTRRHFPSMNPSGIASAVDGLADIGIITRPQRRGNEMLFSFNGTWSLESMEAALTNRGEVLRREMEACGLDATENRFASVLWELKRIVGLL